MRPIAKLNVGIIGTGVIFDAYARGIGLTDELRVTRVADIDVDRARTKAAEWSIPAAGTTQELLADEHVDIVVNITPPAAHAAVSAAALDAGKHVYVEKPITETVSAARELLEHARRVGRILGAAPDTFLGQAGQTARAAVDAGRIGRVFAATSFVTSSKTETWHPNPAAFYAPGGGPALDLGPYHLAHLINILGPVRGVVGSSSRPRTVIPVSSPGRAVNEIPVRTNTHTSAVLEFDGVIATTMYSFEVWDGSLPFIEIYGTEGTVRMPKPNRYDEPVLLKRRDEERFTALDPIIPRTTPEPPVPFRALGVVDLARHLRGEPHRTSGLFAIHVLEVLDTMTNLRFRDGYREIGTQVDRPVPVYGYVSAAIA